MLGFSPDTAEVILSPSQPCAARIDRYCVWALNDSDHTAWTNIEGNKDVPSLPGNFNEFTLASLQVQENRRTEEGT